MLLETLSPDSAFKFSISKKIPPNRRLYVSKSKILQDGEQLMNFAETWHKHVKQCLLSP